MNYNYLEGTMIRIYICDDDSYFLKTIEDSINKCILESRFNDFQYEIEAFNNPGIAIDRIKENTPEIIFLDIDMPEINGFNIAKEISEINKDAIIIFVTSHDNYVFTSLRYRPFRFIRKTCFSKELNEALKSAIKELVCNNKYLELGSRYFNEKILLKDIVCFESKRNYAEITTLTGQKYMFRSTISALEKEYMVYGFVRIQAAFLVNMRHIKSIVKNTVILVNGLKIDISRRLINNVKIEYAKYLRE